MSPAEDAPAPRPWGRALAWLALLAPLFFVSYGWANVLASRHASVPGIVYDWEHAIPFWAWTIVPYWSIDLLYAASLFIGRDRQELDRHALRLLTAQVIAVACFVAWPLTFTFVRPETHGVFGWMFDVLLGFDKPFNQAPSLHIVLLVLLWLRFGAHLRGAWRWVLHAWSALIAVSVLTTYQHHFIDIPTGVLAGLLCAWLWPMRVAPPWRGARWARDPVRCQLALAYALGGVVLVSVAFALQGVALWLLWPATSVLLVALHYAVLGAGGFQKDAGGRLSTASLWLHAPYFAAAWINSRWWTRRAPQPVHVADGVWLGRMPTAREVGGVATVIDCCAELQAPANVHVIAHPMLDLVAPDAGVLRTVAHSIEAARGRGDVLVCCALGYSRSASAVAAWLLGTRRAVSVDAAVLQIQAVRPSVVLRARHREALAEMTRTSLLNTTGLPTL